MKRIVNVIETKEDGLVSLLGQYVQLWCLNYIYAGTLAGVNADCVCLHDAVVVYETGTLADHAWGDAQPVAENELFVQKAAIESFAVKTLVE